MIALLANLSFADVQLVGLDGMDCAGCTVEIEHALRKVDGVTSVHASFDEKLACVDGTASADQLSTAIRDAGFKVTGVQTAASCPAAVTKAATEPWSQVGGMDAVVISRGDPVKLADHLVAGKVTVFDFAASWCAPCHASEGTLKLWLDADPNRAVRAIVLPGRGPEESFASKVAQQQLANAPGLPWFVVYGPTGKKLYAGSSVDEAIAAASQ